MGYTLNFCNVQMKVIEIWGKFLNGPLFFPNVLKWTMVWG